MWATQGHRGTNDTALWESMMMYDVCIFFIFFKLPQTPKHIIAAPLVHWLQTVNVSVSPRERGLLT